MLALLFLLLGSADSSLTLSLTARAEVVLSGREIRLADVADLGGLEPSAAAALAPRLIAVLPAGRERFTMSREALRSLVRRGVPGLVLRDGPVEAPLVLRVLKPVLERAAPPCAELARPVAAGAALSFEDTVPVACRVSGEPADIRFDRLNGIVRANISLAAGAYLGRLSATPAPIVDKGEKLTLVASAGPVQVTRDVVAMQAARAGGRLFVRDSEGQVTSAPLAAAGGVE